MKDANDFDPTKKWLVEHHVAADGEAADVWR